MRERDWKGEKPGEFVDGWYTHNKEREDKGGTKEIAKKSLLGPSVLQSLHALGSDSVTVNKDDHRQP